jgi:hypothetical protein
VHPRQSERFEVLEGRLGLRLGDQELVAGPGDIEMVPPGTPHRFWNAGQSDARFLCEIRPALYFESLVETMFTLAVEGKTNSKGMPNPLRLAVIAKAHFNTVRLPFPPAWLQRAALALGAPLGRLAGYESTALAAAELSEGGDQWVLRAQAGRSRRQYAAASICAASETIVASLLGGPASWIARGRPLQSKPAGSAAAGWPT